MLLRRQLTFLLILGAASAWGYFGEAITAGISARLRSEPEKAPIAVLVPKAEGGSVVPAADVVAAPILAVPAPKAPSPRAVNAPANSLANTLDSIQPGTTQDSQIAQRNAYVDRLSQQLKELNTTNTLPPPIDPTAPSPGIQVPGIQDNPYGNPQNPGMIQIQPQPLPDIEAGDDEPDDVTEDEDLGQETEIDPDVDEEEEPTAE